MKLDHLGQPSTPHAEHRRIVVPHAEQRRIVVPHAGQQPAATIVQHGTPAHNPGRAALNALLHGLLASPSPVAVVRTTPVPVAVVHSTVRSGPAAIVPPTSTTVVVPGKRAHNPAVQGFTQPTSKKAKIVPANPAASSAHGPAITPAARHAATIAVRSSAQAPRAAARSISSTPADVLRIHAAPKR